MNQTSLFVLAILCLVSCSEKEDNSEQWCDQLVVDACTCEAEGNSDLCQDAEVVANNGDDESCEDYYFDALPTSCQNYSDDWSGSSGGSSSGSSTEECFADGEGCDGLITSYSKCGDPNQDYIDSLAAYTDEQCQTTLDAWVVAGCCAQYE
jgi:hypothetical protein